MASLNRLHVTGEMVHPHMNDKEEIQQLRDSINDLLDVILLLTDQIDDHVIQLEVIQAILQENVPDFAEAFEPLYSEAKKNAAAHHRESDESAKVAIRKLSQRFHR